MNRRFQIYHARGAREPVTASGTEPGHFPDLSAGKLVIVAAGRRTLLLGQPHSGSIELLLHLGNVVWFTVARSAGTPLSQRGLPLGNGFLEFPLLEVDIAQMIVNGRVTGNHLQ